MRNNYVVTNLEIDRVLISSCTAHWPSHNNTWLRISKGRKKGVTSHLWWLFPTLPVLCTSMACFAPNASSSPFPLLHHIQHPHLGNWSDDGGWTDGTAPVQAWLVHHHHHLPLVVVVAFRQRRRHNHLYFLGCPKALVCDNEKTNELDGPVGRTILPSPALSTTRPCPWGSK